MQSISFLREAYPFPNVKGKESCPIIQYIEHQAREKSWDIPSSHTQTGCAHRSDP